MSDAVEVLTLQEAANFLRLGTSTTYSLAKRGKLPGSKLGGSWRFLRSELMAKLSEDPRRRYHRRGLQTVAALLLSVSIPTCGPAPALAQVRTGTASWYSVESCRREGTTGVMANGKRLKDEAFTAASWDYPLGSRLVVRSTTSKQSAPVRVVVTVTDRGPARRLYRQGRILDLSKASFQALSPLSEGVIEVEVSEL